MPTVPRRSDGFVPSTPARPLQPGAAFQPPAPVDFDPALQEVAKEVVRHQDTVDQAALLEADNQLTALRTKLQQQVLSKRGKDAIAAGPAEDDQWKTAVSEISGGINNRIQDRFKEREAHHHSILNETVQTHVTQQTEKYATDTTEAFLENRVNDALLHYDDPSIVGQSISESKLVVDEYGHTFGWSPEQIQEKKTAAVSRIHAGVINSLLQDDRDIDATKYFEAHSQELDAKSLIQAKDSLDLGTLRGESQRRADSIVQSSPTLGGALREAQKITDAKLREATEGRIRRFFEDQSADQRFEREQAYNQAGVILEQTGDLHKIPASIWLKLSPPERNELQYRLNQKRNPPRATNWDTYARLLNMAGLNDSTRQQFEQLDLSKYRSELDDSDYSRLLSLQLGERRQSTGAVSSEAKRQAGIEERSAKKDAERAAAREMLRSMGVEMPPTVPGAPLRTPTVQLQISPKGKQVPQAWIDHASKDQNYKRYLEHMGVIFDSASKPIGSTGDIILK